MTFIPAPYIIFYTFLSIVGAISYSKKKYALEESLFFFTICFIFLGLRGFIYTDWINYYKHFESAPTLWSDFYLIKKYIFSGEVSDWEKGFLFFEIFCKSLYNNYFFFQAINFTVDFFLLYIFFKKFIKFKILFAFVFYYLFSGLTIEINLLRNAKAILIFLCSIKYIEQRKLIKYSICIFFACLFHSSAIFYLPLYFILNLKISKNIIFCFFLIGNIFYVFQIQWFMKLAEFVLYLLPNTKITWLLKLYLHSDFAISYGFSVGFIERTFSFLLISHFRNDLIKKRSFNIIFVNSFYIYIFIFLYLSEFRILLERVTVLFVFSYWILYPQIYSNISKKSKYVFLLLLLLYGGFKNYFAHREITSKYENFLISGDNYTERIIFNEENK